MQLSATFHSPLQAREGVHGLVDARFPTRSMELRSLPDGRTLEVGRRTPTLLYALAGLGGGTVLGLFGVTLAGLWAPGAARWVFLAVGMIVGLFAGVMAAAAWSKLEVEVNGPATAESEAFELRLAVPEARRREAADILRASGATVQTEPGPSTPPPPEGRAS